MALSRAKILQTAYEVLAAYGLADLSMRRLAAELQVAPGALYYHVRSKQHLLVLLSDHIFMKAPAWLCEPFGGVGEVGAAAVRVFLVRRCDALFSLLYPIRECPEVIRLALALHPQSVAPVQAVAGDMQVLGYSPEQAARRGRLLVHSVLSLVEEAQTLPLLDARVVRTAEQAFEAYRVDVRCAVDAFMASSSGDVS